MTDEREFEMLVLPHRCVWIGTGINIQLAGDKRAGTRLPSTPLTPNHRYSELQSQNRGHMSRIVTPLRCKMFSTINKTTRFFPGQA